MHGKAGSALWWDGRIHRTVVSNFVVQEQAFLKLMAPDNPLLPAFPHDVAPLPAAAELVNRLQSAEGRLALPAPRQGDACQLALPAPAAGAAPQLALTHRATATAPAVGPSQQPISLAKPQRAPARPDTRLVFLGYVSGISIPYAFHKENAHDAVDLVHRIVRSRLEWSWGVLLTLAAGAGASAVSVAACVWRGGGLAWALQPPHD
mmetsp:Transcript_19006/g.28615  ORF Transcript_19006/g.28615 Transcript_19006/m.28615 type:complete len:206 (-) Transcript_19006:60-677(-)